MDVNVITQLISQIGFPIFVAVWLLWKGQQQNEQIVNALNDLKMVVTLLADKLGANPNPTSVNQPEGGQLNGK